MGVWRSPAIAEAAELADAILHGGFAVGVERRKGSVRTRQGGGDGVTADERHVCVTSGASYLGLPILNRLLARGYSVRVAVDTQDDLEKLREAGVDWGREEAANDGRGGVRVVMADVMDQESLRRVFDGCSAVFHTSAFADPSGLSGYTKLMAEMEARAAENVVEACARTQSVRKCVFTSSLLSCVWQQDFPNRVMDERCWSDEGLCRDRRLWYALGKTMAEKAAWKTARGKDIKLVTICPGLVVGAGFQIQNPSASIAYLKGGGEMYAKGLLATVEVDKLAEAHVSIYEGMGGSAGGRYICFDNVVDWEEAAAELERQLGLPRRMPDEGASEGIDRLRLSNNKLSMLICRTLRCSVQMYYSTLD